MITVNKLVKSYGSKLVLKSVSLRFERGKVNGIVGANGAGKTTLFNCIAGLLGYDGKIDYSEGQLRGVVGFLPTHPHVITRITGREYLRLLCNARQLETPDLDHKNIFDLPLDQYAETYSTGMLKKLAFMGVLLLDNEIFLLDEPFSGVDIHSNMLMKELILRLRSMNKIIIMSSHIFSSLNETCDYLHYLDAGQLKKSVTREGFGEIEAEMMQREVREKVDRFIIAK